MQTKEFGCTSFCSRKLPVKLSVILERYIFTITLKVSVGQVDSNIVIFQKLPKPPGWPLVTKDRLLFPGPDTFSKVQPYFKTKSANITIYSPI